MEERSNKTALGLAPRLIAAGWFAAAALMGVVLVLSPSALGGKQPLQGGASAKSVVPFLALPAWIASFFGFAVGARILDSQRPRGAARSMLTGMMVATQSYVAMPVSQLLAIMILGSHDARLASPANAVYWTLLVWGVGAVLVGWLLVIIGGLAGFLLFKFSLTEIVHQQLSQSRRVENQEARVWIALYACVAIAVAILLLSGSIWRNFF